jgi:hypothetical protein
MSRITLVLLVTLVLALPCQTLASAMVDKHIFSPEPDSAVGSQEVPRALELERELLFSGVIISPQGKWAMIQERQKRHDSEESLLRKEGDEINGLVIKHIGNNYLILAGKGGEVRLNLYGGNKNRPAPPSEPETAQVQTEGGKTDTPGATVRTRPDEEERGPSRVGPDRRTTTGTTSARTRNDGVPMSEKAQPGKSAGSTNPFAEALKKAMQRAQERGETTNQSQPSPNNPFLELLRKSRKE